MLRSMRAPIAELLSRHAKFCVRNVGQGCVPVDARLLYGIVRTVRGFVEVCRAILETLLKPVGAHGSRTVRDQSLPRRLP